MTVQRPSGGRVTLQATDGDLLAFTTPLELRVAGFLSHSPHPLTYTFFCYPAVAVGTVAAARLPLAAASASEVLSDVRLPAGDWNLGCTACDADGLCADAATEAAALVVSDGQSAADLIASATAALNASSPVANTSSTGVADAALQTVALLGGAAALLPAATNGSEADGDDSRQLEAAALIDALIDTVLASAEATGGSSVVVGAASVLATATAGVGEATSAAGRQAGRKAAEGADAMLSALRMTSSSGGEPWSTSLSSPRNLALDGIGASLSNLLESTSMAAASSTSANVSTGSSPQQAAYLDEVGRSLVSSVGTLGALAMQGAAAGDVFKLTTSSFALEVTRKMTASLAQVPMTAPRLGSARSQTFRFPPAMASLPAVANTTMVDVLVAAFLSDPFSHLPSFTRAISTPLELSLHAVDDATLGSSPLAISGLSESTPIRIEMPLTTRVDAPDDNPFGGARCGQGNRSECEAELRVLNASATARVAECEQNENSVFSIFDQRGSADCLWLASAAQQAVEAKQQACNALEVLPCSGRGSCGANGTCECDGPYYGLTCGRVLDCSWWDGEGYSTAGCRALGVQRLGGGVAGGGGGGGEGGDGHDGVLSCECTHLTLFEVLWDVEWGDVEIYSTLGWPMGSLPFSKWAELWDNLGKLHWSA